MDLTKVPLLPGGNSLLEGKIWLEIFLTTLDNTVAATPHFFLWVFTHRNASTNKANSLHLSFTLLAVHQKNPRHERRIMDLHFKCGKRAASLFDCIADGWESTPVSQRDFVHTHMRSVSTYHAAALTARRPLPSSSGETFGLDADITVLNLPRPSPTQSDTKICSRIPPKYSPQRAHT